MGRLQDTRRAVHSRGHVRPFRELGAVVLLCGALLPVRASAGETIYAAIGADGIPRYATQKLGEDYEPVLRNGDAAPPGVAAPRSRSRLDALIHAAAERHGLDTALVAAVIQVESARRTQAVSPKGARGLMQMMPATAARYGIHDARRLHDPATAIDAGVRHLKDLLRQHGGNTALALAAYNAGAGAVTRHGDRVPPYKETLLYVPAVMARAAATSASQQETSVEPAPAP